MENPHIYAQTAELITHATSRGKDAFVGQSEVDNKLLTIKLEAKKRPTLDLSLLKTPRSKHHFREFRITPDSVIEVIPTQNGVLIQSADEATVEKIVGVISFHHAENFWEEG